MLERYGSRDVFSGVLEVHGQEKRIWTVVTVYCSRANEPPQMKADTAKPGRERG